LLALGAAGALLLTASPISGPPVLALAAKSAHLKKPATRHARVCARKARRKRKAVKRRKVKARASAVSDKAKPAKKKAHKGAKAASCLPARKKAKRKAVKTAPAAPAVQAAESPSGEAMPVGNIPGWRQVFSDDFSGSSLDLSKWFSYAPSQPGGDPGGWFEPSHVTVSDGELVISTYRELTDGGIWTSGGVSAAPGLVQTYGKSRVRFRFSPGHGIAHGLFLMPADGSWPPEIDFSEDNGENRNVDTATLHYGSNDQTEHAMVDTDLTQWHTLGLEWTPGLLLYTIDGHEWARMTGSNVPAIPMVLDIQTQAWACGISEWEACPDSTTPATVDLDVDWVVAYAPS
jgi:beta-glucanase (GH16 family)